MIKNLLNDIAIRNFLDFISPKGILVDWQIKQLCVVPDASILVHLSDGKKVPVSLFNTPSVSVGDVIGHLRTMTEVDILDTEHFKPMIEHFVDSQVRIGGKVISVKPSGEKVYPTLRPDCKPLHGLEVDYEDRKIISYGLSSSGYDFRVAREFKLFTNINTTVVDALNFDPNNYVEREGSSIVIPPNSFVLARTEEKFNMPKNVFGECLGKSTIARTGGSILVTPLEQGWSGYLTLEYANITPCPLRLHAGMGGGQIVFHRTDVPDVAYDDRDGKYQNQAAEVVVPRL